MIAIPQNNCISSQLLVDRALVWHNNFYSARVTDRYALVQEVGPLQTIELILVDPMSRILSDAEIETLLQEKKVLPHDWRTRLNPRPKANAGHLQSQLKVEGANGHRFRVFVRYNANRIDDFSVVLQFIDEDDLEYTLTRFNGASHKHTNHWEKRRGHDNASFKREYHIHIATERYQREGLAIEGYAEVTTGYSTLDAALREFVLANGFEIEDPDPDQQRMF